MVIIYKHVKRQKINNEDHDQAPTYEMAGNPRYETSKVESAINTDQPDTYETIETHEE